MFGTHITGRYRLDAELGRDGDEGEFVAKLYAVIDRGSFRHLVKSPLTTRR